MRKRMLASVAGAGMLLLFRHGGRLFYTDREARK